MTRPPHQLRTVGSRLAAAVVATVVMAACSTDCTPPSMSASRATLAKTALQDLDRVPNACAPIWSLEAGLRDGTRKWNGPDWELKDAKGRAIMISADLYDSNGVYREALEAEYPLAAAADSLPTPLPERGKANICDQALYAALRKHLTTVAGS